MNCIFIKNVAKLVKISVITLAEIKTKKGFHIIETATK